MVQSSRQMRRTQSQIPLPYSHIGDLVMNELQNISELMCHDSCTVHHIPSGTGTVNIQV